ncbi:DoxX family protein [Amycolatopsis sp. GM8]|uniref:DoxX family protein n=1 Tax=Amycolatopsis sp. GM8 TaxID=2896530 RepID=UPI0035ABC1C5
MIDWCRPQNGVRSNRSTIENRETRVFRLPRRHGRRRRREHLSGIASMTRWKPIMATLRPALAKAGVPESWLVFPIGVLKTAGAVGLVAGLAGVPLVGESARPGSSCSSCARLTPISGWATTRPSSCWAAVSSSRWRSPAWR